MAAPTTQRMTYVFGSCLALAFLTGFLLCPPTPALAQSMSELTVTINQVVGRDPMDIVPEDGASFYYKATIDGGLKSNLGDHDNWYGEDSIFPAWSFSEDVRTRSTVEVDVEIWEDDEEWFVRNGDDQLDIDPDPAATPRGRTLNLRVNVSDCRDGVAGAIAGDLTGSCNTDLLTHGREAGIRGSVSLKITAVAPPASGNLRVRCLHNPIWPGQGSDVTITAVALNEAPVDKVAQLIDVLEVWVDNQGTQTATRCTFDAQCDRVLNSVGGSEIRYGCRAEDGRDEVWSGWRRAQVGSIPQGESAVPIVYTGSKSSRIDIVLIPNRRECQPGGGPCTSYQSAADPDFHDAVREVLLETYYDWDVYLSRQNRLNFWIATDMADAVDADLDPSCDHDIPANWGTDYNFADAGAILHEDFIRDCAPMAQRIFSSEPTSHDTVMHECGHSPFHLADEYCCDGGYFEADHYPNVYDTLDKCRQDVSELLTWDPGRKASDCREIDTAADGTKNPIDWFVSDSETDDLMADDGDHVPHASDLRRMDWIFRKCKESSCSRLDP